jgi:hypothetical protein
MGVLYDNGTPNVIYLDDNGVAAVISVNEQGPPGPPGGGADPIWGDITGTITNQIDLIEYITVNGGGGGSGMFVQPTTPVGATEGNLWYKTDTENVFIYREISPSVFNWVPLVIGTGTSDVIDGGNY